MDALKIEVEEVDRVDVVEESEAGGLLEALAELLVTDPLDVPFESEREELLELLADEWVIPTNKIEAAKAETKTIATTAAAATTYVLLLL